MTNWEKFKKFMNEDCGMHYDEEEKFVICSECGDPIYESEFNEENVFCPVCEYNFEEDCYEESDDGFFDEN